MFISTITTTKKKNWKCVVENTGGFIVIYNLKVLLFYFCVNPPWINWNSIHQLTQYFRCRMFSIQYALCKSQLILRLLPPTQHSTSHQDVKKGFSIAAVVKLGTGRIKKLCNSFQISASLVQTLYDTLLKLARFKSLLLICWILFYFFKSHTHKVNPQAFVSFRFNCLIPTTLIKLPRS